MLFEVVVVVFCSGVDVFGEVNLLFVFIFVIDKYVGVEFFGFFGVVFEYFKVEFILLGEGWGYVECGDGVGCVVSGKFDICIEVIE